MVSKVYKTMYNMFLFKGKDRQKDRRVEIIIFTIKLKSTM